MLLVNPPGKFSSEPLKLTVPLEEFANTRVKLPLPSNPPKLGEPPIKAIVR